ncbi:MAG: cytochrome c biogenesis protein CcsA [Flavobacteriales bacterium]
MEHTFLSDLGYFLIFFSFVAALFSTVSYYLSHKNRNDLVLSKLWKKSGRFSFYFHSLGIIGVITLLYSLIYGHFYEFSYVSKYSNNSMPMRYLVSCFWGGQEGSFLLWMFWNVVIGIILTRKAKEWESSVMAVFVLSQVFLNSMLLGIYVFDFKIGSNVFLLTKNLPQNLGLPWTEMTDYMKLPMFQDGQGLNPLLQNYWMTIHPPTLFLGFALTVVPFSYAIASLMQGKWNEWIKPAISWTFVGVGVLGIGILMGGMWAYESLSFGGFWAWDPVENVSYIPWLTFVGAGHLMLVNQRKNSSLFFAYILTFLSFILVLYSTFLTKSGILGDSSVHSFTDNGMLGQLLFYIIFFVWLSVFMMLKGAQHRLMYTVLSIFLFVMILTSGEEDVLGMPPSGIVFILGSLITLVFIIIASVKYFPKVKTEDNLWSREFWMFLGSFFLLLACLHIFWRNSYPVWNRLFGDNDAGPEDILHFYNTGQGAFAVFIALFVGFGQYLRYKDTPFKHFVKQISLSLVVSVVLTVIGLLVFNFTGNDFSKAEKIVYIALLFTSIYAVIGNLDYFIRFLKGKLNFAGASIAHIGFGLILFGALISNSQSKKLSHNAGGKFDLASLSENFKNNEDVQVTLGDTNYMREYFVSYRSRRKEGINIFYEVDYFEPIPVSYQKGDVVNFNGNSFEANESYTVKKDFFKENKDYWRLLKETKEAPEWKSHTVGKKLFTLEPFVQLNEQFGNVAEPSTKHYLGHDVFSHIKYPDPGVFEGQNNGFMPYENYIAEVGDTIVTTHGMVVVRENQEFPYEDNTQAGMVNLTFLDYQQKLPPKDQSLVYLIKADSSLKPPLPIMDDDYGIKVALMGISVPQYDEDSTLIQGRRISLDITGKEFIIMQAKTFPLINLLWLGCILMLIGSVMAAFYRLKRSK